MYYNVSNSDGLKKVNESAMENMKKHNVIILVRMDGCGYCDMMKPEWNKMVDETKNHRELDVLEIERNMMMDMMNKDREFFEPKFNTISGFPTIMMKNAEQQTIPFQNQRTSDALLDFIKMTSKSAKAKKPASAKAKKPAATKEKKPAATKKTTSKKPSAKKLASAKAKKPAAKKPAAKKPAATKKPAAKTKKSAAK